MSDIKSTNITWYNANVTKSDRAKRLGHQSAVVWFTGLSASGKSAIAHEVEKRLFHRGCFTFVLDGDNIRHGLNKNLGFSPEDREENIRRIGEVASLFARAGMIAMAAFISPYRADRDKVRELLKEGIFIEVHCHCDLEILEERDPKGLYKKARKGEIKEFTGISAPYEEPLNPEIRLDTGTQSLDESTNIVIKYLEERGIVPKVESKAT